MALARKLKSQIIYEVKAHTTGKVTSLDLGETGRVLVTGGSDRNVNLWAIGEEKCFMSLPGHNGKIDCVRFAYNDDFVYSADDIGIIRRWDLNAQSICSTLNGHMKSVKTLDFNPSGEYVVSGSNDTTVRLWDVHNQNRCLKTYRGHIANVNSVQFSPDGLWIASAGTEGSIIIWDIRKSKQIKQFNERGASPVTCIQYHPNELLLAAGRNDGSIYIYDLDKDQLISKTESNKYTGQPVKCITFSENGECLFVGTAEGISVIGWEPSREFDRIESTWNFIGDIKIVNRNLICGSFEHDTVTVHAISIDRVFPFYNVASPSTTQPASPSSFNNTSSSSSPFSHNQSTRKSFTRGNHKLRLSIGTSSNNSPSLNHNKPSKVVEEEYEDDTPSPSLDGGGGGGSSSNGVGGGNSSPNLSIELVDIEEPIERQNSIVFDNFIQTKKQNTYNFPSLSSTTSSRSSGLEDRTGSSSISGFTGSGGGGPSSLKIPGERDINKFEKMIDSYDSDLDYNDLEKTAIVSNYDDEADMEDFPINTPQMPDYAPRYDSYTTTQQNYSNHNHYNHHRYNNNNINNNNNNNNNKPIIAAKPKVLPPFISATSSTTIIPPPQPPNLRKLSVIPSNTAERSNQRKLSGIHSVSTMELHKMDENMSVIKKTTIASRLKRDTISATTITTNHNQYSNQQQQQQHLNINTKNNRKIQVQILTKQQQQPPARSKTSFDLRGSLSTQHIPNNPIQSIPRVSSYSTDDANDIYMLSSSHNQIFSELSNRYATLQLIRNSTRAQDVVGALKQAIKISGRTVFVDLLGAILEKTSTWNLDMCLLLLPEIYELIQSQHKFHHTRACDTLRVILKNFLPIIQDNIDPWSSANSLGVDITRDERQNKCIECQQWLLRIRSLQSDQHIGSALAQLQNMIIF